MAVPHNILHNARQLRSTQTDAENLLWHILRGRRFCGFKFRRQHPVGSYILDFYCHDAQVAIELDGGGHAVEEQMEYDQQRSTELAGAGIRVLRFWNDQIFKQTESVLETIYDALRNDTM